jgi:NAD(P)-dependent dehydrogenase (short-subunit alcohol dehydrogenase family)
MSDGCVVVTGGSRGIGAAIVLELHRRGVKVVSLSRSGTAPAGTGVCCDLTDDAALSRVLATIAAEAPIKALVNNAGFHESAPSATLATAQYERIMALNATAVMVACREAYPYLKRTRGRIVNIGSFFDKLGIPGNLAYCASKAALGAITRCLGVEWARDGITTVNVAPGYIETDLNRDFLSKASIRDWLSKRIPVGAPAQPTQVARLVAALLVEDIPFLTGETIYLDGAQGINH